MLNQLNRLNRLNWIRRHRKVEDNAMILVYEIPVPNTNIELAIQANSTWFDSGQGVTINWGDGSDNETVSATSGQSGYIRHTYAAAGTYTIKISGSMTMYGRTGTVNIAGDDLLTRIDSFGKLGITSFPHAFFTCYGLMSVPKTIPDSVTNMNGMFHFCWSDISNPFNPDVSNWDVSKVTDMSSLFKNCYGKKFNPNVSNWDVSNVTNMSEMFNGCSGAAFNPDVSNWNVSKVTDMSSMFEGCSSVNYPNAFNPNVSNWDVSNVESMYQMFYGCFGDVFNPDVSNWDVSNVTDMRGMFYWCYRDAFNPDVSNWDVSNVRNMENMFNSCGGPEFNPDVSNWDVSKVLSMGCMFRFCMGDAFNPDVSNWDVSNVRHMNEMFRSCEGAAFNPDFSNWNVSKVTDMSYMFFYCSHQNFRGGRGADGLGVGIANWIPNSLSETGLTGFMLYAQAQEATYLDSILNAWAALINDPVNTLAWRVTCHFGTTKYTSAGADSYALLTAPITSGGSLWTIESGGLQEDSNGEEDPNGELPATFTIGAGSVNDGMKFIIFSEPLTVTITGDVTLFIGETEYHSGDTIPVFEEQYDLIINNPGTEAGTITLGKRKEIMGLYLVGLDSCAITCDITGMNLGALFLSSLGSSVTVTGDITGMNLQLLHLENLSGSSVAITGDISGMDELEYVYLDDIGSCVITGT